MSTLLHIDSSPLYGRSVSRELTAAFVTQWKAAHPDGKVIYRDLNATAMPPINAEWVGAAYTPEEARTPQQKELLALSDSLLAELEQADEYVIGVPMHNFGVPSVLTPAERLENFMKYAIIGSGRRPAFRSGVHDRLRAACHRL